MKQMRRWWSPKSRADERIPEYFSRFGGLWTDRTDAAEELARRRRRGELTDQDVENVEFWMRNGYVILPGAVAPEICDAFADELARIWRDGAEDVRLQAPGQHEPIPVEPNATPELMRLVDIWAARAIALDILFAPATARFLSIVFDAEPVLHQSLTFEQGSQQGVHQDTMYVVVSKPMELAATWTAVEDVKAGSGELQYYEGSHRLPEYLFSGEHKSWAPGRDGSEQHEERLRSLHSESERLGLPLRTFLPKKGDTLVWAADLAHGGAPVLDQSLTRRSLVGHYCPLGVEPNYFTYRPDRKHLLKVNGGWATSEYYDLAGR